MDRRHFVRLSGAAGAGLLGLVGAGRALADGGLDDGGQGHDLPPPDLGAPGAGSCPTPSALCGRPSDSGPRYELWERVQVCTGAASPPPFVDCLSVTSTYVVLRGFPTNTHNYLLVPTCRVSGIECPWIATTAAPNYWLDAWNNAQAGQPGHVVYPTIGLGINSVAARQQDQLHIHLAGIHSGIQTQLNQYDSTITNDPTRWRNQFVPILGVSASAAVSPYRTYRVLRVATLNTNLFTLLRDYVVRPTGAAMGDQILAVTPRLVGSGGFYVLNSQLALPNPAGLPIGTATVDFLLAYA
ncbi:CDP-diacylglycerol diphosphatase [Micromonospora siamensis]|uniref:CDP-diacylglycerol diphosphatase n=1 Tax=Micromonospora siamensis TaxID=299152 RepID=UPI001E2CC0AE|nr:CDP-diacylglycerol diphosphatase [Micromonospora siamensis]